MHKSTAFRLLATLEAHRLVEQDGDRGRYRLGVGNLRLAGATTARLDLVTEARPVCRQLAADTGETVNITVRSETSALYLDQVAGSARCSRTTGSGQHIPLHATSNGKVLLSELDDAELKAAVRELPRLTDRTVTSAPSSRRELEHSPRGRVRRRGRRARGRADRGRGADPQRARRHRRLDEHLRARRSGSTTSGSRRPCRCWSRPPPRSRTGSAGASAHDRELARWATAMARSGYVTGRTLDVAAPLDQSPKRGPVADSAIGCARRNTVTCGVRRGSPGA